MSELLSAWFQTKGEFNQISLVWLGGWSSWTLFSLGIIIAVTLYLGWYNSARLSLNRKFSLLILRGLSLFVFMLLFLQPTARLEDVSRIKNHVVVMFDQSRSMSLPHQDANAEEETRAEAALRVIEREASVLQSWSEDHHIDLFAFDGHLTSAPHLEALRRSTPRGNQTSLTTSLGELTARFDPKELAAVIILSDGSELSAIGQVDPPLRLMRAAEQLQTPIHTLSVGPTSPSLDLALAEVRADDFAFARNVVSIDVELHVTGVTSEQLARISLMRGSQLINERALSLEVGKRDYQLSFEFVPEETGEEVYSVIAEPLSGERILSNNRALFLMRVIRDKIRVLQVVGNPSWDERFLRKHLKKNPNVELISFFILRTNASLEVASPDELSLIPFPTQELFEERLGSFDLMIFQDFTHKGYRMRRYLPLIRDYVRRGGGFVMIGGDQSFSGGGYSGTAIESILPVQLPPNGRDQVDLGTFMPELSDVGRRHPITALSLSPEENDRLWSSLPELEGTNRVVSVRRDAQVLAWRPQSKTGGARKPLMIASEMGEGRSLAITTDSLWRWSLSAKSVESDQGARAFHRFWGNAIRWLIRDPALNPLRVKADRDRYRIGQTVSMTTRVLNQSYEPTQGAKVELIIEEITNGVSAAKEVARYQGQSDSQGEVSFTWKPHEEGAYQLRVASTLAGVSREALDLFVVAEDLLELRDTTPRPDLLAALSRHTGGHVLESDEGWSQLKRKIPQTLRVNRREDRPLWSTWWAFLLAILLPTLEWTLRRRWGLN